MTWSAVRSLPALTWVVPKPSMAPTTWFVPDTTTPGAVLSFSTCARLPPAVPKAETEPANSSVAPEATETVNAPEMVGATLLVNARMPLLTVILLPLNVLAPESVVVPAPF